MHVKTFKNAQRRRSLAAECRRCSLTKQLTYAGDIKIIATKKLAHIRLRSDLFSIEWDVKPYTVQFIFEEKVLDILEEVTTPCR